MPDSRPDTTVAIVDMNGDPDMTVAVIGDQVVSLVGSSPGDVLTVQAGGDTVAPEPPGTPGAHAATHEDGGSDEVTLAQSQITGLVAALAALVPKSLFDANTILAAATDDTPAALTVGASTIVGRLAAGGIVAMTVAELKTLLALVTADVSGAATVGGSVAAQFVSGLYGVPPHVTRTTAAPAVDAAYYVPFRVNRAVTISSLGVESTVGVAASTARIGIYADAAGFNTPGALLAQTGDLATTGTGMVEAAVSIPLTPGLYWTAVLAHSTTVAATLRASGTYAENIAASSANIIGTNPRAGLSQTGLTTVLPNPAVPNGVQSVLPLVFMKAA